MTPFEGINRVTSPFGWRSYCYNGKNIREYHRGQDLVPTEKAGQALPESAWNVREVTGGTVVRCASDAARGWYVDVQTAPGVFERYQHLRSILVKPGQAVAQGQVIAVAGSSGQSTGRHLHFGVYVGGAREANAVIPAAWSGVPNEAGVHPGSSALDAPAPAPAKKRYAATVLVKGLRLRTYPDTAAGAPVAVLEKGKEYPLVQTRARWAFLVTQPSAGAAPGNAGAGGWACIEDADGVYLSVGEV